jgi:DNA-binding PadR family transcriptional regulator
MHNYDEAEGFRRGRGFGFGFHSMDEGLDGFRARRGMMESAILGALNEKPMHGYEVITYLEEKTHGVWRPSPGSVYPTLQMLEEKGDVHAEERDGKKVYALTAAGRERAKETKHLHEHFNGGFQHHVHSLRDRRQAIGESMRLMRDITRKGTQEQKDALAEAIDSFKNQLEKIQAGNL